MSNRNDPLERYFLNGPSLLDQTQYVLEYERIRSADDEIHCIPDGDPSDYDTAIKNAGFQFGMVKIDQD